MERNIYAIVRIFGNRDYVKHVQTESDRFRSIERVSLFDWQCAERPDRSPRKRLASSSFIRRTNARYRRFTMRINQPWLSIHNVSNTLTYCSDGTLLAN